MTPVIKRTLDELNRINVPKEFVQALGWSSRKLIDVYLNGDTLVMRAADEREEEGGESILKVWV